MGPMHSESRRSLGSRASTRSRNRSSGWITLLFLGTFVAATACLSKKHVAPEPTKTAIDDAFGSSEADPEPDSGVAWYERKHPCPSDTAMMGAVPPEGNAAWCARPDGVRHGPSTTWHDSGKKKEEATYRGGKKDGRYTLWHPNGCVAEQGTFHSGRLHGAFTSYYDSGLKRLQGEYVDGTKSGLFTEWSPGGQRLRLAEFQLDKAHGKVITWDDRGRREEFIYRYGVKRGEYTAYHPNGGAEVAGRFADDLRVGVWTTWRDDGTRLEEIVYVGGKREGRVTRWHPNGVIEYEGEYAKDKKTGTWIYREPEERKVIKEEKYKNGYLVGRKLQPLQKPTARR